MAPRLLGHARALRPATSPATRSNASRVAGATLRRVVRMTGLQVGIRRDHDDRDAERSGELAVGLPVCVLVRAHDDMHRRGRSLRVDDLDAVERRSQRTDTELARARHDDGLVGPGQRGVARLAGVVARRRAG